MNRLAEAALTGTHGVCFGLEIGEIGIPQHRYQKLSMQFSTFAFEIILYLYGKTNLWKIMEIEFISKRLI